MTFKILRFIVNDISILALAHKTTFFLTLLKFHMLINIIMPIGKELLLGLVKSLTLFGDEFFL